MLRLPDLFVRLLSAIALFQAADVPGMAQSPGRSTPLFPPGFRLPDFDKFMASPFEPLTVEQEAALAKIAVSAEDEADWGRDVVDEYLAGLKRRNIAALSRGKDVAYLQKLVDTLRPLLENAERYPKLRVLVLNTKELEARSFPGGTIVFSQGFLDFARSEAALVGMLGHELSHLDNGHLLVPLKRMQVLRQGPLNGGPAFSPDQFFESGGLFFRLMKPFRPEHEAAADRDGVAWAFRSGYDPRELANLFHRLHEREQQQPNFLPQFLRSHPLSVDREQAVLEQDRQLRQAAPEAKLTVGIENLRKRVPKSQQEFPE